MFFARPQGAFSSLVSPLTSLRPLLLASPAPQPPPPAPQLAALYISAPPTQPSPRPPCVEQSSICGQRKRGFVRQPAMGKKMVSYLAMKTNPAGGASEAAQALIEWDLGELGVAARKLANQAFVLSGGLSFSTSYVMWLAFFPAVEREREMGNICGGSGKAHGQMDFRPSSPEMRRKKNQRHPSIEIMLRSVVKIKTQTMNLQSLVHFMLWHLLEQI